MLQTKLFELRDEGTFIPVMATAMMPLEFPTNQLEERERYLLRRAGYGYERPSSGVPGDVYVKLTRLDKGYSTYNAFDWHGEHKSRTMHIAHKYIIEHWRELHGGEVIDVQFILGETSEAKTSEQHEYA